MSKRIKEMEMAALKASFGEARNLVLLSASKVDAQTDYNVRKTLRSKNIRLLMVKNALARRVFGEMGITLPDENWSGPTLLAWGTESVKELAKAVDELIKDIEKKNPKLKDTIQRKTAVADGLAVPFAKALEMPTRLEAIGEIVGMILGPASTIAGMITSPASQVASQVATIADKKEDAPAETPAAG